MSSEEGIRPIGFYDRSQIEKGLGNLLGGVVSRRKFLALAGSAGLGLLGAHKLLDIPDRSNTEKKSGIYPGWIEGNIGEKKFINFERGHFDWLKSAVFSNPALHTLTCNYYKFLIQNQETGNRLNLGEAFSHAVGSAQEFFREAGQTGVASPNTNLRLEAVRAGILAFSAGFMATDWWKAEDLEGLGIPKTRLKDVNDFFWGENGLARDVFPKLFTSSGERETEPKKANTYEAISGQDRAVHFAQHLAITFEYLYSKQYGLLEEESIPNLAKLYVGYSSSGSIEANARAFSDGIGRFYEVSALKKASNWPFGRDRRKIVEGPFDLEVDSDYKGNRLGAEAAIALFSRLARNQSIEPVLEELSDPRFQYTTSEPVLRSS